MGKSLIKSKLHAFRLMTDEENHLKTSGQLHAFKLMADKENQLFYGCEVNKYLIKILQHALASIKELKADQL